MFSPLKPSASPGTCLEFVSYDRRAEPALLRRAAEWLEANPEAELISIDVVPAGLMAHETFLRMVVVQEAADPTGSEPPTERLISQ